ncbi:MAG: pyruvate ferredoxin oxidoreductase [Chloroflexota bacterium]
MVVQIANKRIAVTGNAAVAHAMKQINPHVVAAYPITPQTDIVEDFSQFVADGLVTTEFVPVESEHSALSTCVGASAAGARVMTATSSQGLALMHEVLYIAAGMRLPIVMPVVNRALSAPVNIHCDHGDSMGSRDAGWIQIYCKNAQEAYDTIIQAMRIAEHPEVRTPVMVCYDGFITSHGLTSIEPLADETVREFVGKFKAVNPLLDTDHPVTYGPLALFDYAFELRRNQVEGMFKAPRVIQTVADEFARISGRQYGLLEEYNLAGAELVVVALSSAASTMEVVVDELREQGVPVGLLRLRSYRPFPRAEINRALAGVKAICVLDRADSPGAGNAPVGGDVRAALFDAERRPLFMNGIFGLGGRDTGPRELKEVVVRLQRAVASGAVEEPLFYLGVRGG